MKATLRLAVAILITTLFACESITAQANPTVSTTYTVDEIDKMYLEHKAFNPQDMYPTQEMNQKLLTDFPNARDIEWEKSNTFYEVEFEIGRNDYKAYYDMQYNLIMYKCDINQSQLPAVVKNAALTKYPKFRFDDTDKIVKGKDTFYKVELEKGKLDVKMILKYDGTIISEHID